MVASFSKDTEYQPKVKKNTHYIKVMHSFSCHLVKQVSDPQEEHDLVLGGKPSLTTTARFL